MHTSDASKWDDLTAQKQGKRQLGRSLRALDSGLFVFLCRTTSATLKQTVPQSIASRNMCQVALPLHDLLSLTKYTLLCQTYCISLPTEGILLCEVSASGWTTRQAVSRSWTTSKATETG